VVDDVVPMYQKVLTIETVPSNKIMYGAAMTSRHHQQAPIFNANKPT
jgi:hypothetical protein